jgi:hypothetical protein
MSVGFGPFCPADGYVDYRGGEIVEPGGNQKGWIERRGSPRQSQRGPRRDSTAVTLLPSE